MGGDLAENAPASGGRASLRQSCGMALEGLGAIVVVVAAAA